MKHEPQNSTSPLSREGSPRLLRYDEKTRSPADVIRIREELEAKHQHIREQNAVDTSLSVMKLFQLPSVYEFSWFDDEDQKSWASIQANSKDEAEAEALHQCGGDGTFASRTLRFHGVRKP